MKRSLPWFLLTLSVAVIGTLVYTERKNLAALREAQAEKAAAAPAPVPLEAEEDEGEEAAEPKPKAAEPVDAAFRKGPARFYLMPDGSPVPPLAAAAPSKIKLSVALFVYDGAQMAPPGYRSRAEAKQLAEAALASASLDMEQALAQGDPGSSEDIGWVRRDVLEKYVEYRLFNLKKDELLPEVIDTPRGFWVVKRTR